MQTASERNSVLLERIAGYRAPLPPHLARHLLVYELIGKKSIRKVSSIKNVLKNGSKTTLGKKNGRHVKSLTESVDSFY